MNSQSNDVMTEAVYRVVDRAPSNAVDRAGNSKTYNRVYGAIHVPVIMSVESPVYSIVYAATNFAPPAHPSLDKFLTDCGG